MAIFNDLDKKYNILELGFDKTLTRGVQQNVADAPPELKNVITDGLTPKNITSGELGAKVSNVSGHLQSEGFVSGVIGWKIDAKGNSEFGGISFNRQFVPTWFESLDGWVQTIVGSGVAYAGLGGAGLHTGTTINSSIVIEAVTSGGASNELNFDSKNPYFETYVSLDSLTNQIAYFGAGTVAQAASQNGFGFKIVNNTLSAVSSKAGVETLTTITGITLTNMNRYQAFMDSTNSIITYYVNGELVATHTTNIPTGRNGYLLSYSIKNTVVGNKILILRSAIFAQDN